MDQGSPPTPPEPPPDPRAGPPPEPAGAPRPITICPHCQAENPPAADMCWMCRQPLVLILGPEHGPAPAAATIHRTFRLSSLMLLIAFVAVFLGLARAAPGLAIFLGVISAPALIRTWGAIAERRSAQRPMGLEEKLIAFIGSVGVVVAIAVAACVAFYVTCWVGLGGASVLSALFSSPKIFWMSNAFFFLGLGGGILGAIVAIYFVGRSLWKRKTW